MSEFIYACPMCGQHIKCFPHLADSVMDCPTCFQKIVAPQAPADPNSKLIIRGTKYQVPETRGSRIRTPPVATREQEPSAEPRAPEKKRSAVMVMAIALVLGCGAGIFLFKGKIFAAGEMSETTGGSGKASARNALDFVLPGQSQSETVHKFQGESSTTGEFNGRRYRDAQDGGWFSYNLKVDSRNPNKLVCIWWGGEYGLRNFDILADGEKVASQSLSNDRPGEFWNVEYFIPIQITKGKSRVTIRWQAQPGNFAGGLFGCWIEKATGVDAGRP